jgi:predicted DNA binding CopG/RHH family protein
MTKKRPARPTPKPTPKIGTFLDAEEKAIYEAIERADHMPRSILTPKKRAEYRAIAQAHMNEGRVKISLRLPQSDLERLKAKALREGLPYQSLIGSILHKAVS